VISEVRMLLAYVSYQFVISLLNVSHILCLQSLRLYPQPPVLIRRSLEEDVLGEYPIRRLVILITF